MLYKRQIIKAAKIKYSHRASKRSTRIVDPGDVTSMVTSWSGNISGEISRKLLETANNSFLMGAYRKGRLLDTLPMSDVTWLYDVIVPTLHVQNVSSLTVLVGNRWSFNHYHLLCSHCSVSQWSTRIFVPGITTTVMTSSIYNISG